jgi:hypothetical protein
MRVATWQLFPNRQHPGFEMLNCAQAATMLLVTFGPARKGFPSNVMYGGA